ncbi:bifunctional oligoribonuclease/PAP phosphatase NrnA [Nanoarchaeota archaeon]
MESEELASMLNNLKSHEKKLYIVGHTGFCYDSIGSAFGLAHIAKHFGLEAVVCGEFHQDWGYPQNNILYNSLDLKKLIHKPEETDDDSILAFVDVYPEGSNAYPIAGNPAIVINHHPTKDSNFNLDRVGFYDTRQAGSTIALVTDHMMNLGVELTDNEKGLATLMLYGMRVDTKRYLKGNDLEIDHRATPFLSRLANLDEISKIESKRYPIEILNILRKMDEKTVGKYRVGVAKVTKPGMVPQLADVLNSFEGCAMSIILAKVEEAKQREWYVSGRSSSAANNVGEIIKELFGSGGGHWYAGGASLTTREIYEKFGVDETKNRSVLKQVMGALEKKLKKLSNE